MKNGIVHTSTHSKCRDLRNSRFLWRSETVTLPSLSNFSGSFRWEPRNSPYKSMEKNLSHFLNNQCFLRISFSYKNNCPLVTHLFPEFGVVKGTVTEESWSWAGFASQLQWDRPSHYPPPIDIRPRKMFSNTRQDIVPYSGELTFCFVRVLPKLDGNQSFDKENQRVNTQCC